MDDVSVERLVRDVEALREEIHRQGVSSAVLAEKLAAVERDVIEVRARHNDFVSLTRFNPVERVVYGLIALVLIAFVGALTGLVMMR
jgi:thiosulfate reductase cytochrome b subunit